MNSITLQRVRDQLQRALSVYFVARAPGILRQLRPERGDRILDVGCGHGVWASALAGSVELVVGVDLDPQRVALARARLAQQGYANAAFVVASATDLPFADEAFTKAISVDVLDNIPNDQQAAHELARVLQERGRLVTTVLLRHRRHYLRELRFPEHIRNYSAPEFVALLQGADLEVARRFNFYPALSTVVWELADLLHHRGISTLPGVGLLVGAIASTIVRLDAGLDKPGAGVGVLAVKHGDAGDPSTPAPWGNSAGHLSVEV